MSLSQHKIIVYVIASVWYLLDPFWSTIFPPLLKEYIQITCHSRCSFKRANEIVVLGLIMH